MTTVFDTRGMPMKKDRRLLIPLGLLLVAFVSIFVQSWIVGDYIYSSIMDHNWESFAQKYGVEAPANGPNVYCLDYCAPELPFAAGWIGIATFLSGLASLTYIWFKPRP